MAGQGYKKQGLRKLAKTLEADISKANTANKSFANNVSGMTDKTNDMNEKGYWKGPKAGRWVGNAWESHEMYSKLLAKLVKQVAVLEDIANNKNY